ncbi:MAG: HD domain-containing protein [Desulfovibrionaceae bacterium]|nr:HD domain-containing protein [Desulfovibrionaceae bacterium]
MPDKKSNVQQIRRSIALGLIDELKADVRAGRSRIKMDNHGAMVELSAEQLRERLRELQEQLHYLASDLPQKSWMFAVRKHHGQVWPGSDLPYLTHIGAVLLEIIPAVQASPSLDASLAICCALLHDTLEDTETSAAELEENFNEAIVAGVLALTKNTNLPPEEAMRDSLARIRRQPPEIWMVKLADRTANLSQVPAHWDSSRCLAYAREAEFILEALGSASELLSERLLARINTWKGQTVSG